ncbi:hypothetical protein E4T43_01154 [Aureobasidium subglaciale]|nr:hypothetical protein E4T43_01154 [Aureobasidium subglaciale]
MSQASPPKRPRTVSESPRDGAVQDGTPIDHLTRGLAHEPLDYPRKRAIIACEICRSRKSRCDGGKPRCKLCIELDARCIYREPGIKLDAGDKLILERLSHLEDMLQSAMTSAHMNSNNITRTAPQTGTSPTASTSTADDASTRRISCSVALENNRLNGLGTWDSVNISTMPKGHTTPALNLLQWPLIRDLISQPLDPQVLVEMEMSRPPINLPHFPRPDMANTAVYASSYFDLVNVWYACVNPHAWPNHYREATSVGFIQGADSCLVLLVLALGSAAHGGSISRHPHNGEPRGIDYFASAWKIIPNLAIRNDIPAVQCYILAAAYLFYLVRPLEAWNMITIASTKLQLVLGVPDRVHTSQRELLVRLFWDTLLAESDLLAELELPHSGIVNFEDIVGLPGPFSDVGGEYTSKDELWYFLAEIALRRLLNRVSHLLYVKTPTTAPTSKLARVTAELDFQLSQWYGGLPQPIKFPMTTQTADSPGQVCLRLRYFACRTIIFRPYVFAVLSDENAVSDPVVRENCRKCLEACLRQIDNVSAHGQANEFFSQVGHLPYLWQGALSLVSQTLLVMGATMSPRLAALLPPTISVEVIIAEVVNELNRLAHLAPSLNLSAEIVREAEVRRKIFFSSQGSRG